MFWISPLIPWSFVVATITLAQAQKNRILAAASVPARAPAERAASARPAVDDAVSVAGD
jgi:hypothetical protein